MWERVFNRPTRLVRPQRCPGIVCGSESIDERREVLDAAVVRRVPRRPARRLAPRWDRPCAWRAARPPCARARPRRLWRRLEQRAAQRRLDRLPNAWKSSVSTAASTPPSFTTAASTPPQRAELVHGQLEPRVRRLAARDGRRGRQGGQLVRFARCAVSASCSACASPMGAPRPRRRRACARRFVAWKWMARACASASAHRAPCQRAAPVGCPPC